MRRTCWVFPILPDRVENARRLTRALAAGRRTEFAEFRARVGLRRNDWFLTDRPGGAQLVAYLEGDDVAPVYDRLVHSRLPFERWLKSVLAETTGLDLNDPPDGLLATEFLASLPAVHREATQRTTRQTLVSRRAKIRDAIVPTGSSKGAACICQPVPMPISRASPSSR